MEDKLLMIIEWLEGWRRTKGISDENVLSGDMLELFVGELQSKIVEVIEDFGPITDDYSDAKLVLYSGIHFSYVKDFCESSN